MTPRRIEHLLWVATIVVAVATIVRALVMREPTLSAAPAMLPTRETARTLAASTKPDDQLRAILAGDVFRRERAAPDSVIAPPTPATPKPLPPPKPRLVLRGIVGGPPWNAILEGVPGHDGSYVVTTGDSVAGLKIRSVRRDGATIRGMDTTWILKLGRTP